MTDDPSGETGTGETGGTEPGTGESGDAGTGTGEQPTAPEGGTGSEGGQPIEPEQPSEPVQPAESEQPADAGQAPTDESASAGSEVSAASIADLFIASEAIADDTGAEPYTVEILDQASADEGATADTDAQSEVAVLDATASDEPIVVSDAGTYYYLITEDVPSDDPDAVYDEETRTWSLDGVTYDNRSYLVTVEVTTSYDAATQQVSMTASVTGIDEIDAWGNAVPRGADMGAVAFSNSYEATVPAMVQLQGTKVLVGRDLHEGETYGFVVRDAEGNPVATGTSGAAGEDGTAAIAFTPFYVTASGTYWIEEIHAGETIDGVTYDANKVEVTVTVTDNYNGTFSAAVSYPNGAAGATFTNTYQVSDEVDVQLEGTKTLVGRAMVAGEFGFVVTEDVDGAAVPVATGQNTAAESGQAAAVAFSTITYTAIGEHDYTVYEVSGNAGGVTYDDAMFSVHVSVTDNGDGTLGTDVTYAQPVSFVNEYGTVDGTTVAVTPEATKTLTGRDMVAGEFTFVATDAATGNVVSTGTNAADGTVAFSTIGLTAQGDYEFVITEVNGRQSGVTYDDAVYRMLVTVSDDGEGGLVAEVDYPDGLPRFANSYTEPAQPSNPGTTGPGGEVDGQVPKTSDDGNGLAGAAALALGGLGAAVLGGGALLRGRAGRR